MCWIQILILDWAQVWCKPYPTQPAQVATPTIIHNRAIYSTEIKDRREAKREKNCASGFESQQDESWKLWSYPTISNRRT